MADRIYLDTNVYNRPFDQQTQARVWLETLAFSVILQIIESSDLLLVSSTVVAYENSLNPDQQRKKWVDQVLELSEIVQLVNMKIRERALQLEAAGLKALDSLHLAAAEAAKTQYFITADDRLIRRYRSLPAEEQLMAIYNPTEFVRDILEREK